MIARTSIAIALLFPAALGGFQLAAATSPTAVVATADDDENSNPVLHEFMEDVGKTMRGLGRGVREEGGLEAGLIEVRRLQNALMPVRSELPTTVTSIEDARKRAASEIEWLAHMNDFMKGLLDLELEYARGDADAVLAQLGELDTLKKASHRLFKP
ncbi:hypothetical protein Pla163_22240 [Planctomycetes bacterium Pla163]|uniref:Cytochrome b562 n=1 Tax=Rohdeia mirabilis TaxID=2528008 RepID=A0A518D0X2_9BACT|nr:hypothetical protein Pla163_22240 [Planctomycetes bacterium Pla163]